METKEILAGCQLMQEGNPLTAEPVSGTVAVRPLANGPFVQANGVDLVKTLSDAYPKCQFLYLANPAKVVPTKAGDAEEQAADGESDADGEKSGKGRKAKK